MPVCVGAQLGDNFLGSLAGPLKLSRRKADGADARMSAAAVALADLCQVDHVLGPGPWVRTHGNLHPEAALAQSHAVHAFRMQVVGNELVVALQVISGHVEEDGPLDALAVFADDFDRTPVPLQQRRNLVGDKRRGHNLRQRTIRKQLDQPRNKSRLLVRLNGHGDAHRRFLHGNRDLGALVAGSIHNVCPLHQFLHWRRVKAETALRHRGQELCTGLEVGIEELGVARLALEVLGVRFGEERAFVMIKPPGQLLRGQVLEIDDSVFVPAEVLQVEQRSGAMQQSLVLEFRVPANALAVETRKQRSRASPVKTSLVIEDLDDQ